MRNKFIMFILGAASMLALTLWIISPVVADLASKWNFIFAPPMPIDMAARGQFGDSFGVATSLFSFLSFMGVLIVYHMQKRHADVRDKPFLMTSIQPNSLPLKIEVIPGNSREYHLSLEIGVNNYSDHLAHSSDFTFSLISREKNEVLPGTHRSRPIMKRDSDQSIHEKWTLDATSTRWLLDDLSSGSVIRLAIKMNYLNSNSVSYSNTNNFEISVDSNEYAALNELRSGGRSDSVWGGGKYISVDIQEVQPFVTLD